MFFRLIGKDYCKTTLLGLEYTGRLSQTWSGLACQAWSTATPHNHTNILPGSEGNFCRNPNNSPYGPWCYTMDVSVLWEYCDVPYCDGKVLPGKHKTLKRCWFMFSHTRRRWANIKPKLFQHLYPLGIPNI